MKFSCLEQVTFDKISTTPFSLNNVDQNIFEIYANREITCDVHLTEKCFGMHQQKYCLSGFVVNDQMPSCDMSLVTLNQFKDTSQWMFSH